MGVVQVWGCSGGLVGEGGLGGFRGGGGVVQVGCSGGGV